MGLLKFSRANAKLVKLEQKTGRKLYSFSLPSGYTCPFAEKCLSKVVVINGKKTVKDGPKTEFRCYSASQEALYAPLYRLTQHNFSLLKDRLKIGLVAIVNLISNSLPSDAGIIRIHESGDFFNEVYFRAWLLVAKLHPHIHFYAYTKSIPYWIKNLSSIPANMKITASYGGRADSLIESEELPNVRVVYSRYAARKLKRPVDKTDYHAYKGTKAFCLIIHNTQPKNSQAAKAWQRIKKHEGGYNRKITV